MVGNILIWLLKEKFWDPSSTAAAAPIDDPVPIPRSAWLEVGNSSFLTTCAKRREKHCQGHAILFWVSHECCGYSFQKKKTNNKQKPPSKKKKKTKRVMEMKISSF